MSASSSSERHPGRPECNDSPIGELIEGLNAIAALPIPYARLPKRAQVGWAPVLRTWGDVAAETPGSLLARPKAGQALLQALLGAAEEAVATARTPAPADAASSAARLLVRLSEHDRIVLAARTWALHPAGTDEVAARLGAGRNAVLRHQPRAQQRFVELLDDPAHADLKTHGAALAARLGAVTTEQAVKAALAEAGVDHDSPQGLLLTYVAGPYRPHGVWLETPASAVAAAETAVRAAVTQWKIPTTSMLIRALAQAGVVEAIAVDFLQSCPGLRRFGDRWVRWGSGIGDQIEAVLHLARKPTTAEVIGAVVGQAHSAAAIRSTLFDDARFIRASRYTWALREWGGKQYRGIYSEILARVDARWAISVAELVRDITSDFPDVSEVSIRTYASGPAFVIEDGIVRRRTPRDGWRPLGALNTARGVFCNGDNEIRVCYSVDRDLLRGSGQHIHPAVAMASVAGVELGDALVLVLDRRRHSVSAERIAAGADLAQRLTVLLGKPVTRARAALARSLSCPAGEVSALLRARGDVTLADLIDSANNKGPQRD